METSVCINLFISSKLNIFTAGLPSPEVLGIFVIGILGIYIYIYLYLCQISSDWIKLVKRGLDSTYKANEMQ